MRTTITTTLATLALFVSVMAGALAVIVLATGDVGVSLAFAGCAAVFGWASFRIGAPD